MLLQELIKLSEGNQAYVLALMKGAKVLGFYVADDEDVVKQNVAAYKYKTQKQAESAATKVNGSWELKSGEEFKAIPLTFQEEVSVGAEIDLTKLKIYRRMYDLYEMFLGRNSDGAVLFGVSGEDGQGLSKEKLAINSIFHKFGFESAERGQLYHLSGESNASPDMIERDFLKFLKQYVTNGQAVWNLWQENGTHLKPLKKDCKRSKVPGTNAYLYVHDSGMFALLDDQDSGFPPMWIYKK